MIRLRWLTTDSFFRLQAACMHLKLSKHYMQASASQAWSRIHVAEKTVVSHLHLTREWFATLSYYVYCNRWDGCLRKLHVSYKVKQHNIAGTVCVKITSMQVDKYYNNIVIHKWTPYKVMGCVVLSCSSYNFLVWYSRCWNHKGFPSWYLLWYEAKNSEEKFIYFTRIDTSCFKTNLIYNHKTSWKLASVLCDSHGFVQSSLSLLHGNLPCSTSWGLKWFICQVDACSCIQRKLLFGGHNKKEGTHWKLSFLLHWWFDLIF